MCERLEEMPVPVYLPEERKADSRSLYQAAFPEDTERFVDFYYQFKTRDNRILTLEMDGEIVSMLHRNPYRMIVNGYEARCDYIVAVATALQHRHQGYMRTLLEHALRDMASEGMPFTFLMPASEQIYAPFDFVWICPYTELPVRVRKMDAEEQNRYLAARYQVFCRRDERYMENLRAEMLAEAGETAPEKIPPYMARITDVCQMLRMVYSQQKRELYLHVKDPIVQKNNGYFLWESGPEASEALRLDDAPEHTDLELTIGELTAMIFAGFRICLSEAV